MYRDPEADFQCADCGREAARLHTVAGRLVCEPACAPAQNGPGAAGEAAQLPASTPRGISALRPGEAAGRRPIA